MQRYRKKERATPSLARSPTSTEDDRLALIVWSVSLFDIGISTRRPHSVDRVSHFGPIS